MCNTLTLVALGSAGEIVRVVPDTEYADVGCTTPSIVISNILANDTALAIVNVVAEPSPVNSSSNKSLRSGASLTAVIEPSAGVPESPTPPNITM